MGIYWQNKKLDYFVVVIIKFNLNRYNEELFFEKE